jgi:uncharacterized protein YyaL (SSP411 family)
MDETSYSDPSIIDTINKEYVPVRVDTDKRPDVNRRYNLGGWPTTAFLNSEGEIITGGTYIPPVQLREVLRSVADFYSKNKGRVKSRLERPRLPMPISGPLNDRIIRDIATTVAVNFDIEYGGFGFEPKFPHTDALSLAMIRYRYDKETEMLKIVTHSLDMMAKGGMYDHVENGFFRYSTTRDWSIPHFEKMAEDNARLLNVYLEAYQLTKNEFYKNTARNIIAYVNNTLLEPHTQNGFYGSQDADEKYYNLDLRERKQIHAPNIDRTFYTNYNALFISAYLDASRVLNDESLANYALKTLQNILAQWNFSGSLPHYWPGDDTPHDLLGDIALLVHAFIDAYEHTANREFLENAIRFVDHSKQVLEDNVNGGFYDLPLQNADLGQLKVREKPLDENSLIALALVRLSWLTNIEQYRTDAENTIRLFAEDYEKYGLMSSIYGIALDAMLNGPVGITLIGSEKERSKLVQAAFNIFTGRRYVQQLDPSIDHKRIENLGYGSSQVPIAYVCVKNTCGPPITDENTIPTWVEKLTSPNNIEQSAATEEAA